MLRLAEIRVQICACYTDNPSEMVTSVSSIFEHFIETVNN